MKILPRKNKGYSKKALPGPDYLECIEALDNIVHDCISVSQKYAGIKSPSGKYYFASVFFTMLCTRGVSLAIIAPHSPWSEKLVEHWDYASVAGIVRTILEIRLALFYLCVDKCSPEEWDCRWNLFNLHDCQSRIRLFTELDPKDPDVDKFNTQAEELRSRLLSNAFFMTLEEKQRNKFLKGRDAYLFPLEDICEKVGIERSTFRWLYQLLSSHVHALPMSFYRMGEQERGSGVHSEQEEGYTQLCLSFAVTLLVAARDEIHALFSAIETMAANQVSETKDWCVF